MILKLKIKTTDQEIINVNEVIYIGIGKVTEYPERPYSKEELCIRCDRGMFTIPLSKISKLEFNIDYEKTILQIKSMINKKSDNKRR